jgi:hypothetical protein
VQHARARVAELDLLAVAERLERECDAGGLVQAVRRADLAGMLARELWSACTCVSITWVMRMPLAAAKAA